MRESSVHKKQCQRYTAISVIFLFPFLQLLLYGVSPARRSRYYKSIRLSTFADSCQQKMKQSYASFHA